MPDIFLLDDAPCWYAIVMRVLLTLGAVGFCVSTILWALAGFKQFGEKLPFWQGFAAGTGVGLIVVFGVLFIFACLVHESKVI